MHSSTEAANTSDPDSLPSSMPNARSIRRRIELVEEVICRKARKYALCFTFVAGILTSYRFNTTATEQKSWNFTDTDIDIALIGLLIYFLTKVLAKRERLKCKLATLRIIPPEEEKEEWSMCALLSGITYFVKTKEELEQALRHNLGKSKFEASIKYCNRRPTADHQDGDDEVDLPVISVIENKKLYVVWQGTSSIDHVVADMNVNANIIGKCRDVFPNIKVHSGVFGYFHDQLHRLDDRLEQVVNHHNIEEVVFSGHSLGGGIAQIALMTMIGVCRGENRDKYESLSRVKFRAKVFASPMVFSIVQDKLTTTEKEAIKEFQEKACNWFYGQDPIPCMPGNHKFWIPAVTQIVAEGGDEVMKETLISKKSYLGSDEALISRQKYNREAEFYLKSLFLHLTVAKTLR
mmetsp:Transcript_10287/g.15469  ORF Transcript_10287/g.15469 Transcript_10287/m.15469 type:complete len:406 (+) Transcript_10287:129-1346(+)